LDFDKEQSEMLEYVRALRLPKEKSYKKGEWNKYVGDVTNRVVVESLAKHLPRGCRAIGPGAYVEGISTEFDMLIVKSSIAPAKFTNAYPRVSVLAAVEVKKTGVLDKKDLAEDMMREHRQKLVDALKEIPLFYITFHESERLIATTKKVYRDNACFMSTGTNYGIVVSGEWKRFVELILSVLGK
jgi:hypothetical protein